MHFLGRHDEGNAALVDAIRAPTAAGPLPDGASSIDATAALIGAAFPGDDVGRMLTSARRAFEFEANRDSPWRIDRPRPARLRARPVGPVRGGARAAAARRRARLEAGPLDGRGRRPDAAGPGRARDRQPGRGRALCPATRSTSPTSTASPRRRRLPMPSRSWASSSCGEAIRRPAPRSSSRRCRRSGRSASRSSIAESLLDSGPGPPRGRAEGRGGDAPARGRRDHRFAPRPGRQPRGDAPFLAGRRPRPAAVGPGVASASSRSSGRWPRALRSARRPTSSSCRTTRSTRTSGRCTRSSTPIRSAEAIARARELGLMDNSTAEARKSPG